MHGRHHNNPEVESILCAIEDILNREWMDKSWTPADILQLQDGLEILAMDALEVAEKHEIDEEDELLDENE